MVKKTLFYLLALMLLASIVAGLFFEAAVREYYPGFSSVLLVSALIFFGGIAYAIIERNMAIAVMAIFITALVPFIKKWLVNYWGWLNHNFYTIFPFFR